MPGLPAVPIDARTPHVVGQVKEGRAAKTKGREGRGEKQDIRNEVEGLKAAPVDTGMLHMIGQMKEGRGKKWRGGEEAQAGPRE